MNKIIPISVVGILVLSLFGIPPVISKYTISDNQPPNDPEISGPSIGKVGVKYIFNFVTSDPENQNVSYFIEWGDGTSTGWTYYFNSGQVIHIAHTWYKINQYAIRCKAKDIYNAESNWTYMDIPIAKNTALSFNFNQLERLFEQFPHMFPILQHILDFN